MLTGDLRTFIDYFRTFCTNHPDLKFFMFGGVEKGIEAARSFPDFDYPLLWLEEPIINTTDNTMNHVNDKFMVGVTALLRAPGDNLEAQIDAYTKSLQIITDLQAKLRKDRRAGLIQVELEGQRKLPVSQLWIDGHYGFRLEFGMDLNINATIYGS
ncbi:hypothetical protein [Spirosoma endbachense]|uniref:Uncharacterized protein n=1 Tax=Spirosoma endbachense TaxID=2666025 RepID=A0A6P1W0W4_9BACT|nr:hypothetical protein [Spirosoma endbachense]QHV97942.1 hypothetical protein GJR95_24330 [Spirosoma endbachense]